MEEGLQEDLLGERGKVHEKEDERTPQSQKRWDAEGRWQERKKDAALRGPGICEAAGTEG